MNGFLWQDAHDGERCKYCGGKNNVRVLVYRGRKAQTGVCGKCGDEEVTVDSLYKNKVNKKQYV
ncbi:hypothetical protein [Bacillus mycoides]|uniref:hypothetical protein n=1 Tax=Bacillus mycoides TaxID=1405 RepID=UPI003A8065E0